MLSWSPAPEWLAADVPLIPPEALRATPGLDQPLILYRFLGNFGPYTGARFGGTLTWADAADPPSFRHASQSLWPGTRTVNPKNLPGRQKCHEKCENWRLTAASYA